MIFKKSINDRLLAWFELRKKIEIVENPLELVVDFWNQAPFTPYNKNINQYDQKSWPTPWQILVDNIYDDFTVALMMSYSIKYTEKYKNTEVKIETLINSNKTQIYNIVIVDNYNIINYQTGKVNTINDLDSDLYLASFVLISRQ